MSEQKADKEWSCDSIVSDLGRQAHDRELKAIADLTILRGTFGEASGLSSADLRQKELDERLKRIISDLSEG